MCPHPRVEDIVYIFYDFYLISVRDFKAKVLEGGGGRYLSGIRKF